MNIFNVYQVEGIVVPHSVSNVWELRVNGVKNCKGLFNYFDNYTLVTKKNNSYVEWKLLYSKLVNKDHLNQGLRLELVKLAKQINKTHI